MKKSYKKELIGLSTKSAEMQLEWVLTWVHPDAIQNVVQDSYVNLIHTPLGGTHDNGLRAGVVEAVRDFCELPTVTKRC